MRIAQRLNRLEGHLAPQIARERAQRFLTEHQRLLDEFGEGSPQAEALVRDLSDADLIAALILSHTTLSEAEVETAFRQWPSCPAMLQALPYRVRREWQDMQDMVDSPEFQAALAEG